MKSYDFTNEQVQLLKEAINAYSEQCAFQYSEGTEDKMVKMARLYQMLSNPYDNLDNEEEDCVHPICDY